MTSTVDSINYGDEKILHYNECFSYPDGTDGPNANTVTPKVGVVYNGVTYNNAYNFNKTDARYIILKAPKDGTLFMAFDGGTYNINVLKTGDTEPKSYSCNNTDQNVIAVPVVANGEYKIYQNGGNDNARLAYAEFVPVPEAEKVYRIIDVETGKYVELSGDNIELGGETPSGDLSNDFKLTDAGNGYFNIYPQSIENKVIDYDVNNKNIHIYNSNGNNNQKFQFILNDDGTYKYDFTDPNVLNEQADNIGHIVDLANSMTNLNTDTMTEAETIDQLVEEIRKIEENEIAKEIISDIASEYLGEEIDLSNADFNKEADIIKDAFDVYQSDPENFDIESNPELKEKLEDSELAKSILEFLGLTSN